MVIICPILPFLKKETHNFLSNSLNSLCLCYFFPSAPFNLPETVPWIQISKQGQTKTLRKACRRWHTWFCFNWNWLFCPFLKMLRTYFHAKKFEEALVLNLLRLMIDQILVGCHEIIWNEKLIFLEKLQRICWASVIIHHVLHIQFLMIAERKGFIKFLVLILTSNNDNSQKYFSISWNAKLLVSGWNILTMFSKMAPSLIL